MPTTTKTTPRRKPAAVAVQETPTPTAAKAELLPLTVPPITCGTPGCKGEHQGTGGYAQAWDAAVLAGWRTDVTRQRRCPACVENRLPSAALYMDEGGIRAFIASQISPGGFLDDLAERQAERFEIAALPPLPPALDELFRPEPADAVQADALASLDRWSKGGTSQFPAVTDAPAGEPEAAEPAAETAPEGPRAAIPASAAAEDWDALKSLGEATDGTKTIPVAAAETEFFGAVTDGDEAA